MKKAILTLIAAAALLGGCSTAPAPAPSPVPQPTTPAPVQETAPKIPAANEVCLKPEDRSGISISLFKPLGGHSVWTAKPGWTIARPWGELYGSVEFPKPVDPGALKVTTDNPDYWQPQALTNDQDRHYTFKFYPEGKVDGGKPGWVTLKIDGVKYKDGSAAPAQPLTLKLFIYDLAMQDSHRYLLDCWSSIMVPDSPH